MKSSYQILVVSDDHKKTSFLLRALREADEITWIFEGFKSEKSPEAIHIIKESIRGTVFSDTDVQHQ